ncbi:MAG: phytanoyl-CoA dioxygenase family protein [Bryobacteraceae bacterium]|nr:phytanoyl-CoA dioxygenase family protein [Bryobacteraceae bacterium]
MYNHAMPVSEQEKRQLDEQGFVVLRDWMSADLLREARAALDAALAAEGENAGAEFRKEQDTQRLANLVDKGEVFRRVVSFPEILEYVGAVIPGRFKLSSLNARSPNPHSDWVQPLHCDTGQLADDLGNAVCNVIWMLDDFTAQNGATRVVPGSHKWRQLPQDVLADAMAPHPDEILVTGRAGSVAVVNTHAWHGGTANRSGAPRRCLHAFYCRWDKPQQQFQRNMLREETKAALSAELRDLLAIDDEENARISLAEPLRSGFLK